MNNSNEYLGIAQPTIGKFQLLGDSIFVRFSNQYLDQPSTFVDGTATIGYCVSGQRIYQLTKNIMGGQHKLKKRVTILIGTNDVLCGRSSSLMCQQYRHLLELLASKGVKKFVLLTLPPVPKLALTKQHWEVIEEFNSFLRKLEHSYENISVIDIQPLFLKIDIPFLTSSSTVSLKRKSKSNDLNDVDTPKKRKLSLPPATEEDDAKLSPFGKWINSNNRKEKFADSCEEMQPCFQQKARIDYYFWNILKKDLCLDSPQPNLLLTPKPLKINESLDESLEKSSSEELFEKWMLRRNESTPELKTPVRLTIPSPTPEVDTIKSPVVSDLEQDILVFTDHFLRLDYFEKFYYNGRIDMIHPNSDGLQKIYEQLKNSNIF